MKKVIGLTGGIASGKSTVVDFLISQGYTVIDADKVVRELQEPYGKLNQAIFDEFGEEFFDEERNLKRSKLAALVFSDDAFRTKLGELQNHIIREALYEQRNYLLTKLSEDEILFMDIPLLIEQSYNGFDEVWLIAVEPEIQIQRIMTRDGLSEEEAKARVAAQMPLSEKMKYATRIIDSSGTIEQTRAIVKRFLTEL
jgi:dephospho-CoA kinase